MKLIIFHSVFWIDKGIIDTAFAARQHLHVHVKSQSKFGLEKLQQHLVGNLLAYQWFGDVMACIYQINTA